MRSNCYNFTVCILLLGLFSGCLKNVSADTPRSVKSWACNERADQALKRMDYQTGILLHQRIVAEDPHNAFALYHLGYAYGNIGAHDREVDCYEKAVSEGYDQNADLFYNLGMAYGELEMPQKAISAFQRAVALNPENAENHFGLALAIEATGDFQSAEAQYLNAVAIDPGHLDARLNLSRLYVDMGDFPKARDQLKKILEIDPAHDTARQLLNTIESL